MTELETPAMPRRANLTSAAVVAEHHPSAGERTAVDKALEVLAAFPPGQVPVGVSELARDLALTKSTVFRLLSALERNGLVERVEGRYRLGAGLHDLGARVYEPVPGALHAVLVPLMAVLYERTRENVNLGVLREGEVVLLGRLHGPRPVPRALPIGTRSLPTRPRWVRRCWPCSTVPGDRSQPCPSGVPRVGSPCPNTPNCSGG
jgi:DNA-binding transcriptional ArsR family regulator